MGEVEWMELEDDSNAGTSVAFLMKLRQKHPGTVQNIRCRLSGTTHRAIVRRQCGSSGGHRGWDCG